MNKEQRDFYAQLEKVNQAYLDELEHILLSLYHKLLYDRMTVDDIQDIGERFGLDIQTKYLDVIEKITIHDEEDD